MNWLAATGVAVVATYLSAAIGSRLGANAALKEAGISEKELNAQLLKLNNLAFKKDAK